MAVSISGEGAISGSSSYSFDSKVSVGGTLTYEDVTSVDSVGIITAQSGIHVTGGVQVGTGATITGSTNIITASTNGSERLRIASNGRVAIGNATNNASPTSLFGVIADDGEAADLYIAKFQNLEATAGQSYGVDIRAGSNSTDHGFRVKNRANDTTQFLVRGDGNVGIGTDNPNYRFVVGGSNQAVMIREGTGTLAGMTNNTSQKLWFQGGNAELGLFRDSNGDYEYILGTWQSVTPIPLVFRTGNRAERMRIAYDGKVGIGSDAPTQALDVVGRISKTEYEPGELIECLETIANGIECTLSSGSYTPTNVSSTQDLSSSYADINGSVFTYNVPVGTKRLVYDFWVYMKDKDVGPLLHFKGLTTPDGSSTYTTVNDSRATWRGSTANADYQMWIHNRMVLFENSIDEEDIGAGKLYLLGGTTRKLKFQCREYSASYEGQLHTTNNWDGSGTDILVRPHIRISAYA